MKVKSPKPPLQINKDDGNTTLYLLDSGITVSLVKTNICRHNKYHIKKISEDEPTIHMANNKPIKVDKKADMEIRIPNLPNDTFRVSAYIYDNLAYDYIFGTDFLEA